MRRQPWKVLCLFIALELVGVGGLGAWAAQHFGFPYASLSTLTLLIVTAAGFFVSRAGGSGILAGVLIGFLDVTTWAAFGGIGPQPRPAFVGPGVLLSTLVVIVGAYALAAWFGGWLGRRWFIAGTV